MEPEERYRKYLPEYNHRYEIDRKFKEAFTILQISLYRAKKSCNFLTRIISAVSCPLQPRATYRLAFAPLIQLIFDKAVAGLPDGCIVQEVQGVR